MSNKAIKHSVFHPDIEIKQSGNSELYWRLSETHTPSRYEYLLPNKMNESTENSFYRAISIF